MRLGLIGDVHAEDELLEKTLAAMHSAGVDRILCTGDLVDGEGNVDRACDLLRSSNALIVRGNHDRWIRTDDMRTLPHAHRMTDLSVDSITLIKDLPQTLTLDIPPFGTVSTTPGKLLLCHGVGKNDMCRLTPDDYGYAIASNDDLLAILFDVDIRVMVGGHTHKPMLRRFERGPGKPPLFVVNAGTLARENEPGYAILSLSPTSSRVDFHRVTKDSTSHVSCVVL